MEINDLLNPVLDSPRQSRAPAPASQYRSHDQPAMPRPRSVSGRRHARTPSASSLKTPTPTPTPTSQKKRVRLKTASFSRGRDDGAGKRHKPVRYPPFEIQSRTLLAHLRRFGVDTDKDIQASPQFTPYSSNKKDLFEKAGCEGFATYQYKFHYNETKDGDEYDIKNHRDEKERVVMWDYNTGLVRMTPLFKSQGWSKTTPKKAIEKNEGLMALCPSVTGGAIAAQGYWMPYEAARAMATTFCYNIRYALTPLFGADFPAACTPPDDPAFGVFAIENSHVRAAAARMRDLKHTGSVVPPATPRTSKRARDDTATPDSEAMTPTPTPTSKRARIAHVRPPPRRDIVDDGDDGYMPRDKYAAVQRDMKAGAFSKAELFTSIAVLWEKCGFGDLREYVDVRDVIVVGEAGKARYG